MSDAILLF